MAEQRSTSDMFFDPHESGEGGASPRRSLWRLLRGRTHWAVMLALLLGAIGTVAGYRYIDPVYRSTGQVRVSPEVRPVMEHTDGTRPIPHYDSYLDAQASLVRSRQVIERAVRHEAWQRVGGGASEDFVQYFRSRLDVGRNRGSQVLHFRFHDGDPFTASAGVEAAIHAYHSLYQQQQARTDEQIAHQLEERRGRLTEQLAQLRERRGEIAGQYGVEGLARRYQLQLEQLSEVQEMLRRTRVQLQAMREQEEGDEDFVAPSLDEIARQDDRMRQMLEQREQLNTYIDRNLRLGLGENHREIARARIEREALDQQIEDYAARFAGGELALPAMRQGLDPMMPVLDELLSPEELQARERDLERMREQMRAEAMALGTRQQAIDDIQERLDQHRVELAETERYIDRLNLQAPLSERIEVIAWGEVPNVPHNQGQRLQAATLAGGAGAMLGIALVMLMGRLDRRMHRVDDAQGSLPAVRMLGILPTLPADLAAPEQVAVAAHCVHHIRTLLQVNKTKRHTPVLMRDQRGALHTLDMTDDRRSSSIYTISSPEAGAGKTSLTIALGLSFATSETRTLLIDCDIVGAGLSRRLNAVVHRPLAEVLLQEGLVDRDAIEGTRPLAEALGRPLGDMLLELGHINAKELARARLLRRESSRGLLDVCEGDPLQSCLAGTGIPRLSVLPIGAARPHQAGLLSPSALKRVFDQARQRFDVVLVDTGPIPGSIEAAMATAEADQIMLVVSRGVDREAVHRSLNELQSIGTPMAGVVFNHALAQDVLRSSSVSNASGMPESHPPLAPAGVDDVAASRFGPVGSAVASFADRSSDPRRAGNAARGRLGS